MWRFIKKYWWVLLLFIIVIPLLINGLLLIMPGAGTNDGWLGFWGGYLGVIPSGLIAYYVSMIQIKAERKNYRNNHLQDLFLDDLRRMPAKIENINNIFKSSKMIDYLSKKIEIKNISEESYEDFRNILKSCRQKDVIELKNIINQMPNIGPDKTKLKDRMDDIIRQCDNFLKTEISLTNLNNIFGEGLFPDQPTENQIDDSKELIGEMMIDITNCIDAFVILVDELISFYSSLK